MFATAANFIIALIEERPVAAGNILRDAGGAKAMEVNVQELQERLEKAMARKIVEAQLALASGILNDALRIEFTPEDCEPLVRFTVVPDTGHISFDEHEICTSPAAVLKVAEEAFEMGRRSVEETIEAHATAFAVDLEGMERPQFLEVNVL